jgi:hypothetical protein
MKADEDTLKCHSTLVHDSEILPLWRHRGNVHKTLSNHKVSYQLLQLSGSRKLGLHT